MLLCFINGCPAMWFILRNTIQSIPLLPSCQPPFWKSWRYLLKVEAGKELRSFVFEIFPVIVMFRSTIFIHTDMLVFAAASNLVDLNSPPSNTLEDPAYRRVSNHTPSWNAQHILSGQSSRTKLSFFHSCGAGDQVFTLARLRTATFCKHLHTEFRSPTRISYYKIYSYLIQPSMQPRKRVKYAQTYPENSILSLQSRYLNLWK